MSLSLLFLSFFLPSLSLSLLFFFFLDLLLLLLLLFLESSFERSRCFFFSFWLLVLRLYGGPRTRARRSIQQMKAIKTNNSQEGLFYFHRRITRESVSSLPIQSTIRRVIVSLHTPLLQNIPVLNTSGNRQ